MRSFKSNENIHKKEGGSYYPLQSAFNLNHSVYKPLSLTEHRMLSYMATRALYIDPLIPKRRIFSNSKFLLILSYAFMKSMKVVKVSFLFIFLVSLVEVIFKMWSTVLRFFVKPFWLSIRMLFELSHLLSLSLSILQYNLYNSIPRGIEKNF